MPGKKKKGGKRKKAVKKKEYDPMVYDFPKFDDPDLVTPKIDLLIKLADPSSEIFSEFPHFSSFLLITIFKIFSKFSIFYEKRFEIEASDRYKDQIRSEENR